MQRRMPLVLIKVLLLGTCLAVSLSIIGEVRFPLLRSLFMTAFGFALSALSIISIWVLLAVVLAVGLFAIGLKSYRGLLPVIPALGLVILLLASPGSENQLYLEVKYPDEFIYIDKNLYYSRQLESNVHADRVRGDDYQSYLYNAEIERRVAGYVQPGVIIHNIRVERVLTNYHAKSLDDYVNKIHPEVVLRIECPKDKKAADSRHQYVTRLEVI